MTSIRSDVRSGIRTSLYYRIAPDTGGAYTIAVTLSGLAVRAVGGAVSYTGAKQSGQPDAHNGNNGTANPATVTVTTVADNSWVFATIFIGDASITCDNTERWNVVTSVYSGSGEDTNGPKTPAGGQVMSWSGLPGTIDWAISAASFAPAAGYDISNAPSSEALGILAVNTTYYADGSAPNNPVQAGDCTFTITNNGASAIDLDMKMADFTGGVGWNIDATPPPTRLN